MSPNSPDGLPRGRAGRQDRADPPESIGAVLGQLRRARPLASGIALGQLGRLWSGVVGDRLAAETRPVGLQGGTLVVEASTAAWAAQVRFLSEEVREGANRVLAGSSVRSVRVVLGRGGSQ